MNSKKGIIVIILVFFVTSSVFSNGGPFVIKYPGGDPAAKGVLARLGQDLKPGKETNLRVIKEELKIAFVKDPFPAQSNVAPLIDVSAAYTIENPLEKDIEVDFGFPILRGIYIDPFSMMPAPEVNVKFGGKFIQSTIISNSGIYGIVRQRARKIIDDEIAENKELKALVESVRNAKENKKESARKKLNTYLIDTIKFSSQDAALMVEYSSIDIGIQKSQPADRSYMFDMGDLELYELMKANLGPLSAIGEQKATQFFARLALLLDPNESVAYEDIFNAWGGDVREQSVDLITGKVRPREITVASDITGKQPQSTFTAADPTIYARVDYLDPKAKITDLEKESCQNILKNLPVIFTFAPMNILYYKVTFPASSTQTLTVSYKQYAYSDTRSPESYQVAYVVHPASFWKEFGPINLEVTVPEGIRFKASDNAGIKEGVVKKANKTNSPDIYTGNLKSKTGEIYLAVDANQWKEFANPQKQAAPNKN